MTTTTKIFVILVCLFAFIFTPMAIQFAARVENWRGDAEAQRANVKAAVAREQAAESILHAREADWQRQFADEQSRFRDALQQIARLQQDLQSANGDKEQLARSREMLETQTGILTAEVAVKSKHNEELGDAREKALASQRELQTANQWLTDQLQLARANLDVLTQQLRQSQQMMTACRQENDDLRRTQHLGRAAEPLTAVPGGTVEPLTPPTRSKITGKVKQVKDNLVSIDVGSASGVKVGMRMIIIRNGTYVGDIKITNASPGEAVGQIALIGGEGKQVRAGDEVVDETTFSAG